jgi:cyclophilin family peptidyl-prolyl cis-trans isomerase
MHRMLMFAMLALAGAAAAKTQIATVETSMGSFEVTLYDADAPKSVANFVGLAKKDFYNGILFHRVVAGFVIQAGDPKTKDKAMRAQWGSGGESIYGGEFADELDENTPSAKAGYDHGVLAMANHGPNTNSSQFFVCTAHVDLPHAYTIFGKVTKGLDVVDKIGAVQVGAGDCPTTDVVIKSVKVREE